MSASLQPRLAESFGRPKPRVLVLTTSLLTDRMLLYTDFVPALSRARVDPKLCASFVED